MTVTNTGLLYRWMSHQWPSMRQPQHSAEIAVEASTAAYNGYCTCDIRQQWRQRLWLVNEAGGSKGVVVRS